MGSGENKPFVYPLAIRANDLRVLSVKLSYQLNT